MRVFGRRPLFLPLLLVIGLAAGVFAVWQWRQITRSGAVYSQQGVDAAAAKQYAQAEQAWLRGVRQDPDFLENHVQLGALYAAQGRFADAAAQYGAAARLSPKDGTLFLRLARAEESAGEIDAAVPAALKAAALRPDDAETQEYAGTLAARMNQPKQALPLLRRAHELSPDNSDTLIYLVRAEIQVQDLAGAERDLAPFLQRHPESGEAAYLMGYLLEQKPLTPPILQAALGYAKQAYRAAPSREDVCILLGQLELENRNFPAALVAFRQGQKVAPQSLPVLHGLITCYVRLKQPAIAAKTQAILDASLARKAKIAAQVDRLRLHPEDTNAALEMARLQEADGNLTLAETYYRQAVHYAPQNLPARAALAAFLRRQPPAAP